MSKRNKRKKRQNPSNLLTGDWLIRRAKREVAIRSSQITAIFRVSSVGEPELIGTGVFVAIDRRRFLITAGHVFGPVGEGHQILYIPSHKTADLKELVGEYVRTKPDDIARGKDSNDAGIVLLDDDLANQIHPESFLRLDSVDVDDIGDFDRLYMAMGFPWRKSPKSCSRTRMATATLMSYPSELLPHKNLERLGHSPNSHFLLRYAKRHSRTEIGRDITAPDPHGMSGGPLWRIEPENDRGVTSCLVGIIIEWHSHEGGLLAIRLPVILAGIGRLCPDIAHLIPTTQTINIKITSPPLQP